MPKCGCSDIRKTWAGWVCFKCGYEQKKEVETLKSWSGRKLFILIILMMVPLVVGAEAQTSLNSYYQTPQYCDTNGCRPLTDMFVTPIWQEHVTCKSGYELRDGHCAHVPGRCPVCGAKGERLGKPISDPLDDTFKIGFIFFGKQLWACPQCHALFWENE